MFNRTIVNSREYKPLLTTQRNLRLRNLIKITGINLDCDNNCAKFYFTLHFSAFSKPFYWSKSVEIRNNKAEWKEISIREQYFQKSSQRFICVRVWQTSNPSSVCVNATDNCRINNLDDKNETDRILFSMLLHFSGLVVVNCESSKFKPNTLLFHLVGGLFASSDQIIYQKHQINDKKSNISSNSHHNSIIPSSSLAIEEADYKKIQQQDCDKDCSNRDTDRYSNCNSLSLTNGNNYQQKQQHHFIEIPNHHEFSDQPAVDIISELMFQKVRYVHLNFFKNEMQSSYTLEKLLQMQEMQRSINSCSERSQVLANRICMKSPACLDLDLIMTKPVFYEPQKQPTMGRTLSRLLTQAPPRPEILLKGHELRIKLECARFRIKLLSQERDRSRQFNKQLIAKREKLKDDNTEMETLIWNSVRTLNRENLRTYEEKLVLQREVFLNLKLALLETKRFLLKELNEIYVVRKHERHFLINGIHLPDAESYADSHSTPVEISIALGYVAHAVIIISRILNVPLRNAIIHEGSRSKIKDDIKILAPSDRTFPLFCRIMPPPNVLLYGVYLLNQNISQLKFMLGMSRGDLRATLANLWDLTNGISAEMYNRRFVEDVKPVENSASSMDSVPINVPLSISSFNRRKSRSLEDFEDLLEDFHENIINSSAPDLTQIEDQLEQI